jgi:hypothetical protein
MSASTSDRAALVMLRVSAMGLQLQLELAMAMLAVSVVPEQLR